jgi:bifunctional non-homologous end joining protein LigD
MYVAFDLLWQNNEDLRLLPLSMRRKALQRLLPKKSPLIEQSYVVGGSRGQALYDFICAHDLEGVIAKRLTDFYDKRTKWYKIKNPSYTTQSIGRKGFFDRVRKRVAR